MIIPDHALSVITTLILAVSAWLVTWGSMRQRIKGLERDMAEMSASLKEMRKTCRSQDCSTKYATKDAFDEYKRVVCAKLDDIRKTITAGHHRNEKAMATMSADRHKIDQFIGRVDALLNSVIERRN